MCEWEICVYASVCICAHTSIWRPAQCVEPSLVTFHVIFWARVSLNLDLSSWQVWLDKARVSPVSTQFWDYVFVPLHLSSVCVSWRAKLMLSYLHNKYSTNWAIFPNLIFFLFMDDYFFISCHILFIHWPISEHVNYMSWLLWLCSNDQVNTDNTLWYWFLFFYYLCIYTYKLDC